MVSSKPSGGPPRRLTGLIASVAILLLLLLLLLFFSNLIERPHVQAVKDAVLLTVDVPSVQTRSTEARASLNLIPKGTTGERDQPITLPFIRARGQGTDLVQFVYSITLDTKTIGSNSALFDKDASKPADSYGLLFIQIINGGDFYLNGYWVAGLARSTNAERWMWYQPFVVPLPSHFLKTDGTPNVLTVSQSTLQSYISIPRIYFGDMNQLNRVYSVVQFFSSTLINAVTVLGFFVGLFFLGIWSMSPNERIYALAGAISILWAVMIVVFRLQQFSTDLRELWRWFLYANQGVVISLVSLFILSFIDRKLGRWTQVAIFGLPSISAVSYALGGNAAAQYIDLLWPPVVLILYAYSIALLIGYGRKNRSVPVLLFLAQSLFFITLAIHDYAVQSRLIDGLSNSGLEAGWSGMFFEQFHGLFLALPFFLFAVSYVLLVRYREKVITLRNSHVFLEQREIELQKIYHQHEVLALSEATLSERDRIYQDIHDGIGSQLVKAIFIMRSTGAASSAVVRNLQACLADLRLVIDAQPESNVDIQTTVFSFCETQEVHLGGSGLEISYDVGPESTLYPNPKVNLNVLRVLQESLNNTIKHAGATSIDFKLELSKSHLTLSIRDNGHGQRASAASDVGAQAAYGASGNRGIAGLSRRAADIGAAYTINITEYGTKVRLSIPLPDEMKIVDAQPTRSDGKVGENTSPRSEAWNATAVS